MAETNKTQAQLLRELAALRRQNAQLAATVAAQRQAEAAVRASEQRYRHLVEQSLGLMCMHTLDGTLLAVNPAAARRDLSRPDPVSARRQRAHAPRHENGGGADLAVS